MATAVTAASRSPIQSARSGEDRVRDDEAAGRAEVVREQRARSGAGDPAGEARDEREDDDLGRGDEQDLRAPSRPTR